VYPAIAVLQALEGNVNEVLWIGSQSGMEETLLKNYKVSYQSIPAAGLHGVGLHALPGNLAQLFRGWQKARALIAQFQPQTLFFTGGYLGVPVALAGRKIPSVVFVPDIEPGLALKTILRPARTVALSCEESLPYVPAAKAVVTGYPVRKEMTQWSRESARAHFDLPADAKVLLVFGGSKGARSINNALAACLPDLLQSMHVIHVSGKDNWAEVQPAAANLPKNLGARYHAFPFLHEDMGAAFAAADLAICRSGASTLGELPAFGLPAILVPYPHTWHYQRLNADYLARRGGAVILEDGLLMEKMKTIIASIMNDERELARMRAAMTRISNPDSASRIADLIRAAGSRAGGGK